MEADRDALLSCDVVAALPDGAQADGGTAREIRLRLRQRLARDRSAHGFSVCAPAAAGG